MRDTEEMDVYESEYAEIKQVIKDFRVLARNSFTLRKAKLSELYGSWIQILEWAKDKDDIKGFKEFYSRECPLVKKHREKPVKAVCSVCKGEYIDSNDNYECAYDGHVYRSIGKFRLTSDAKFARKYVSYLEDRINDLEDNKITPPELQDASGIDMSEGGLG